MLGITPGQSILWHAGASGVSIAGIQLARAAGAGEIFATAGSAEKCAFIESQLGATAAFNYRDGDGDGDWAEAVLQRTGGRGVDLIVDFVGASYFEKNLRAVARDGRIVLLGFLGGSVLQNADIGPVLYKRVRVEGSALRSRDPEYQGRLRDKLEEYLPRFEDGTFKLFIDKVLPFERVVEAHKLLEANTTKGKIICTVD